MVRISWMMLSDQVAAPLEKNKETISFPSLPLTPSRHILFFFLFSLWLTVSYGNLIYLVSF